MDEFERVYGPDDDDEPPLEGELINVTPAPFLPYADSWIAWLEHARTCEPCTRATIRHIHHEEIFEDELCAVGVPLGIAFKQAIHAQRHASLLN